VTLPAGNAFHMRRVPFEPRSVAVLAGAALLPFVPAAVLSVPLAVMLQKVSGIFL